MKSLLLKGLVGTVSVGVVSAGGFLTFKYVSKPMDVKGRLVWEGYTVADLNKDGVWKAIYLSKGNEKGFSDFVSGSDKVEVGPKLKEKCANLFAVSSRDVRYEVSYEDAKTWCLNPVLTTIEMQFEFEDRAFALGDDDFKNLFVLNKGSEAFVKVVKTSVSNFEKTTPLSTAYSNVRTWCDSMKSKAPFGDDLKNAKQWCTKPASTLKAFMDAQGFKPVGENGWNDKFSALKSKDTNLSSFSDVSGISGDNGATKLKEWCNGKGLETNLIHSLENDLEKVKERCFVSK